MWRFACRDTLIIKIAAQDLNPLGDLLGKYSYEPYIACYLELCLSFPFSKWSKLHLASSRLCGVC